MLEAFRAGADAVEIDLHLTADSKLVVVHDEVLGARYGVPANQDPIVTESALDDLCKITFGGDPDPNFPDQQAYPEHIPSLADLLDATGELSALINFELKLSDSPELQRRSDYVAAVRSDLNDRKLVPWRIKSFDLELVQMLSAMEPKWPVHVLIEKVSEWDEKVAWCTGDPLRRGISVDHEILTEDMLRKCQQEGIHLSVFTLNDCARAKTLVERGVSDLITDDPEAMIECLRG